MSLLDIGLPRGLVEAILKEDDPPRPRPLPPDAVEKAAAVPLTCLPIGLENLSKLRFILDSVVLRNVILDFEGLVKFSVTRPIYNLQLGSPDLHFLFHFSQINLLYLFVFHNYLGVIFVELLSYYLTKSCTLYNYKLTSDYILFVRLSQNYELIIFFNKHKHINP